MFVLFCVLVYAASLSTADETIYGNISIRKHVSCSRPQHPAHGRYTMYPPGAPGSHSIYLQLNATCDPHYHLVGAPAMACVWGVWSHPRPECVPLCREERPSGVVSCPGRAERCLLNAFRDTSESSTDYDYVQNSTEYSTYYDYEETTYASTEPSTLYPFGGTCELPAQQKHGSYESIPWGKPGDRKEFFQMTVTCSPNYALLGSKTVFCLRGTWSEVMPQCIPYCASETEQGVVTCGTHEKRCMRWKSNIDSQEGCGYLNNNLFTNGLTSIPWIAGLYVKNNRIFGTGTLISKRVIITSATNFRIKQAHLFRDYLVAVGNIMTTVSDISNVDSQTSDINEIIMHPDYTGQSTEYRHNLALVVAANEFHYNEYIRPVCLSFNPAFNEALLQKTIRREVQMISWDGCIRTEHPKYITPSEYRTRMPEIVHDLQDEVICVEDVESCYTGAGAGLMIEAVVGGRSRYILRGVSSEFLLYRKNVSLYTDIFRYNQFIKSALEL